MQHAMLIRIGAAAMVAAIMCKAQAGFAQGAPAIAPGTCPSWSVHSSDPYDVKPPAYYFPPTQPSAQRPALPVGITVWRVPCDDIRHAALWVRMTPELVTGSSSLFSVAKPKVTVVQDGLNLGTFGAENDFAFMWDLGLFANSRLYWSAVSGLIARVPFRSDAAFTLKVRAIDWPASAPDLVYDIPARDAPGNVAELPRLINGLWWNPAESGWGLSVDRNERGAVFAAWFTYDAEGQSTWFVMSQGVPTAPNTVEGDVYYPTGPAFSGAAFAAGEVRVGAPVGRFRLHFPDNDSGTFSFDVLGRQGSSRIERLVLRNAKNEICQQQRVVAWNPAEPGWALSLEGSTYGGCPVHATWFTYGPNRKPLWLFAGMFGDYGIAQQNFMQGVAYRPRGTPFGEPYEPAKHRVGAPQGEFKLDRGNPNVAWDNRFTYSVGGISRGVDLQRFRFEY